MVPLRLPFLTTAVLTVLLAVPVSARAQERAMTGDEIRDIARREMLWCESWQAETDDCAVVTVLWLEDDGRLAETSTLLIQEQPRLQVFIADHNQIDGDRLCSKIDMERTRFAFTLEGRPAPMETSLTFQALFMAQMAEFDGKTICQSFFRGDDPHVVREEITVDGERREDLESTYLLRDATASIALRPQLTDDDKNDRTHL